MVLIIHAVFSWLFIIHFKWGLVGAAITLNTSWWLVVIGQLLYILITKSDGAWSGFSWLAFRDLYGFVKLSLASAVMLWYQLFLHSIFKKFMQVTISISMTGLLLYSAVWSFGT